MEKRKIEDLLDEIGIPLNLKGYKFWTEAIQLKLEDENITITKIEEIIAEKYSSTKCAVERNLRHCRECAETEFGISIFNNIGYELNNGRLLDLLVRELKRREE